MKGSIRKPLAQQKGHLNVVTMQKRRQEEESIKTGFDQIVEPPEWLKNKIAIAEWKRILPQLLSIDVVGNLDLANVAGYCNAYANYRKATEELDKMPLVYVDKADGKTKSNPYIDIQAKYAQEMRRFADLCGMSISSRLKAAATKTQQTEDVIESKFGVI